MNVTYITDEGESTVEPEQHQIYYEQRQQDDSLGEEGERTIVAKFPVDPDELSGQFLSAIYDEHGVKRTFVVEAGGIVYTMGVDRTTVVSQGGLQQENRRVAPDEEPPEPEYATQIEVALMANRDDVTIEHAENLESVSE